MKKIIISIIIIFEIIYNVNAGRLNITGFVRDSSTKEPLIGANIYFPNTNYGTITNSYGYFTFSVPDEYIKKPFTISFLGYKSIIVNFHETESNIYLLAKGIDLGEVNIFSSKNLIEKKNNMSVIEIPVKEIQKLPQLIQSDVIKTIQFLPGIQGGVEGSTGLYVRGGSNDQNLVLLDDIPVFFINHAGNLVSVFDYNSIKEFKIYKGAFPARYGGRLSSVLDIKMKEGNKYEYHGEIGLGLISGNGFIEGPIIKDKSSFFLSYRRFWPELIINSFSKYLFNNYKICYGFDDLSIKISNDFNKKNKLLFSMYNGGDVLKFKYLPEDKYDSYGYSSSSWHNTVGAVKYIHIFSDKVFSDFTIYYTKYQYKNEFEYNSYEGENKESKSTLYAEYLSNVQDIAIKAEFDYTRFSKVQFKFGEHYIIHNYIPGLSKYNKYASEIITDTINFKNIKANENSFFIESIILLNKNIDFNVGVRNTLYIFDKKYYYFPEPRIIGRFEIPKILTLKASYAQMTQTVHLLTYSGAGVPNDLWLPSTEKILPATSKQYVIGIFKTFGNNMYETSIECYFKNLNNMIAYKEGLSFFSGAEDWQEKIETNGKGISKGVEFLFYKKSGKLKGWIGYTLSKSDRLFKNKNNGMPFPFNYDRKHDISIVGSYDIRKNLSISFDWVFGSGYPITLAFTKYYVLMNEYELKNFDEIFSYNASINNYKGINAYRMRNVHRLDIALIYTKKKKKTERVWTFSIYNVYNRQNPVYYFYSYNYQSKSIKLYQQSLFPILPSATYSIRF
jgi:hypothetical protein